MKIVSLLVCSFEFGLDGVGAFYLTFSLTKKAIVYGPLYERKESGEKQNDILCLFQKLFVYFFE